MAIALAAIGAYVLLVGVASFIESPVGRGSSPSSSMPPIRIGGAVLAIAALLAVQGITLPAPLSLAAGLGIGLLTGAGSICYYFALNYRPLQ
ncbi:MAG: hypothetical protein DLM70_03505 [Chloroflexi bacterium]|nr:MAG: hypothetical protein DLM70_03505 [Chloroflexota bacterium]